MGEGGEMKVTVEEKSELVYRPAGMYPVGSFTRIILEGGV